MKRKLAVFTTTVSAIAVTVGVALGASTPAVVTGSVSGTTEMTASLHGSVNPDGSHTSVYFQFGPTNTYGQQTSIQAIGAGTKALSVAATATGLVPGSVYHYRIVASNRFGTSAGSDRSFTTAGHPPAVVITGPIFAVGKSFAIPTGNINPEGEATNWAFQYGITSAYGSQTFGGSLPASSTLQQVHEQLSGLSAGTTFHYRLIAIHGGVTVSYGGDQTFTTYPSPRPRPLVQANTTPHRAKNKPYLFTVSGKLIPPRYLPASVTCSGVVAARFFLGHTSRALQLTFVKADCTFSMQVLFHKKIGKHSTRLRVEIRYRGNPYLESASPPVQRVHLG